jgi:YHS domain-containing protein
MTDMRQWILIGVLVLAAGCAETPPRGENIREGKGYCPVCVDWHEAGQMRWPLEYQGKTFLFCDPNCKAAFLKDPEKYLKDPLFNPAQPPKKEP